jgi:D-alanyl-D-alanine carboxypeptidase/D-alanyl-D-alanine-endopeptidase (penicillin-binding protein 4)
LVTDPQQPSSRRAARDTDPAGTPPTDEDYARRRITLISVAAAVTFLLLGTGSVFVGLAVGRGSVSSTGPTGTTSTSATREVPPDQVAASQIPTCSISGLAGSSALGKFYGSVVNASDGTSVYSATPDDAQAPASSLKVLTAAAAIAKLGPNFRITTKVVDGVTPGSITLVGEGDATLSRVAPGGSVYAGAPTMAALASKTLTAYAAAHPDNPTITQVVLDSSYWDPNDNWNTSVPRSLQTGGFLSETTALQVDGDRQNPKLQVSPRGNNPVKAAGNAFVKALGLSGVTVITGQAENGAPTLASVQSQPVSVLVKQMLLNNDDTLAEMLARIISVKESLNGTSSSIQQAITMALGKYSVDTSTLTIDDGSGESPNSAISPAFMSNFMTLVLKADNGLQYVKAGIPLAGRTGGLVGRFIGPASAGAGHIYAKPGSIAKAYTLSGYMNAKDGTKLAFAFFAEGSVTTSANAALDTLATGVYKCGKNLTSF